MEIIVDFFVFFVVYGSLWYLFTERKRKGKDGQRQPHKTALIRTAAIASVAGVLFIIFYEVIDIF